MAQLPTRVRAAQTWVGVKGVGTLPAGIPIRSD